MWKRLSSLIKPLGLGALLLGPFLFLLSQKSVTFQSLESETETGAPVFNQVSWQPGLKQDVWLMRQSQGQFHKDMGSWDKLKIVVDKSKRPYQARFYQEGGYKARCFACHANGPRAIRPQWQSPAVDNNVLDRLRVAVWNMRIKTYGRVESVPGQDDTHSTPFRSQHQILARPLGLTSCLRCHASGGLRNPLTVEHLGTARFMLEKGLMPPFPFKAAPGDLDLLNRMIGP